MAVYIGVDFHARQQTVSSLTTESGEIEQWEVEHKGKNVREFYSRFKGEVIVGLEASAYIAWFEELMLELGHEVWIGDAAEIRRRARRRQKNDRRDSELILELMIREEFPRIHRQSRESRAVLKQVRYRHRLVKLRTIAKNSLQAMALNQGGYRGKRVYTKKGRAELAKLGLSPEQIKQGEQMVKVIDELSEQIKWCEQWLWERARPDEQVMRLQTHPGVGLLTSLVLVHTLTPVSRFSTSRKVTAYLGLDPVEHSSADRIRIGSISKQGSRLGRFLVIEAGAVAARVDDGFKQNYKRLSLRRGKPKAKVAMGRKLLVDCFIMLRDQIDYAEFVRRGVEVRCSR